jgi:tetratricopeptide (TPR) repeat protein
MILTKKILIGFIFLFLLHGTMHSQDLLDYANSRKYADYLFETQQYRLSSIEFERVVFLEPTDTTAQLRLIRSYRYLNNYPTARNRIEFFFPGNLTDLPPDFAQEHVKLLLHQHLYPEATDYLREVKNLSPPEKAVYEFGILTLQHQWGEASEYASCHNEKLAEAEHFNKLNAVTMEGLNTRYKSTALATSLSIIIPGAGKLYTKRWKDALYSFLFVSATSWLTYKSYVNNGVNFSTVMLGSAALGLYSANIYGTYKSASKFNQKINQSFTRAAEEILLNDQRIFLY